MTLFHASSCASQVTSFNPAARWKCFGAPCVAYCSDKPTAKLCPCGCKVDPEKHVVSASVVFVVWCVVLCVVF
jgi:hypothetical protein